jgi:hypothetical protein
MFSRLDPVFQAMRRQTENADTRLGIRRDEKNDPGTRKEGKEKDDEPSALWEDVTTVSIPALQAFLTGLVPTGGIDAGHADISISTAAQQASSSVPVSDAARAAQAYRSTPGGTQAPAAPPPTPASNVKLSPDEEKTIFRLIADLAVLSSRGVTDLRIYKSDSFLQSLVDAVQAAL